MEKVKVFLLGMLVTLMLMVLVGAGSSGGGKFQIAAGGGSVFYVLDTDSGKIVQAGGSSGAGRWETAIEAVEKSKNY
jgi:hypothetical protein